MRKFIIVTTYNISKTDRQEKYIFSHPFSKIIEAKAIFKKKPREKRGEERKGGVGVGYR